MRAPTLRRLSGLTLAGGLLVCLVAPPTASAAKPAAGGRYLGEKGVLDSWPVAALQVAGDGRHFGTAHHGSHVECIVSSGTGHWFALRRPHRVRIGPDGRFAFLVRSGKARLRLRGRFASPDSVRISYRVRPRSACDPAAFTLHRKRDPPFSGCRSQPADTVAQTDTARIFEQSKVGSLEDRYLFTPIAFGCLYSVDKRFKLGEDRFSSFGGEELDLFRLSGAYAGFARMVCGPLVCGRGVKVVDLRTGRTVQDRNSHEADSINSYHASDLVLKDNASLAWIASDEYANPDAHEVRAFDSLGARKLDSGTSIRPKSLELNGSTITWRHGNETRSAILY